MQTWIALFRGINVGGNNIIRMADLRALLESMGLANVQSYIQSGNVVFESEENDTSELTERLVQAIEDQHGFRPKLLLLTQQEFLDAIASNPFPEATSEPKTLHFFFLAEPAANADRLALNSDKTATETFTITPGVFYLHTPDGLGRSKLAARAEKHLGVVTTARNYRTVDKLRSLLT